MATVEKPTIAADPRRSDHEFPEIIGYPGVSVRLPSVRLTDDWLLRIGSDNPELRFEVNAEGDVLVMTPTGSDSGKQELRVAAQVLNWADRDGTGEAFGPSTGFRLPNNAVRAADAAWVRSSRLEKVSRAQRKKFLPLCPDVVVEVRSPSDRLRSLMKKMEEWIANGALLGWLIDPIAEQVYVYKPGAEMQKLPRPETLAGEPVLSGFVLDLKEIWPPKA